MPGFNIGGGNPDNTSEPSPLIEIHRAHRWRIFQLGDLALGNMALYAKTLSLPGFTVEEEIVNSSALKYKFAKMVNWEDVVIEFYDVFGMFDALVEWQNLVFTPADGIGVANDYKKNCVFELTTGSGDNMDANGNLLPVFTLNGAWPKQLTHSPLSYENSELKTISLVLSYDYVTFEAQ